MCAGFIHLSSPSKSIPKVFPKVFRKYSESIRRKIFGKSIRPKVSEKVCTGTNLCFLLTETVL